MPTLVTKSCKPTHFGNAKNAAVRNLLGKVSDELFERIDDKYLLEAAEYFDYKCPYSIKDISRIKAYDKKNIDADHLIPANKEHLGLTIKGNILLVDHDANNKKNGQPVDEFILENAFFASLTPKEKKERLAKIKKFQNEYYYDTTEINVVLKKFVDEYVAELEEFQKRKVAELKKELYKVNSVVVMKYFEYVSKVARRSNGAPYQDASCKAYTSAIRTLLSDGKTTIDDLVDSTKIDALIKEVSNPSSSYYKSGNTPAALKIFKDFSKTI